MKGRVNDKIDEIERFLGELLEILPTNIENYARDFKTKAACERYFEKIVEAIVDLAYLVVKGRNTRIPEEDKEVFDILSEEKIISQDLAERLKNAKGMRNIIAHEYGTVNDEIVFHSITEEIEKDVTEFVEAVKRLEKKEQ